jgi:hypothetical protein
MKALSVSEAEGLPPSGSRNAELSMGRPSASTGDDSQPSSPMGPVRRKALPAKKTKVKPKGGDSRGGSARARDPRALIQRSVDYLLNVLDEDLGDRQLSTGVAAASRVLSHAEWYMERTSPEMSFIRLCGGPERAWRFLAENRERLEASLNGELSEPLSLSPPLRGPGISLGTSTQGQTQTKSSDPHDASTQLRHLDAEEA